MYVQTRDHVHCADQTKPLTQVRRRYRLQNHTGHTGRAVGIFKADLIRNYFS